MAGSMDKAARADRIRSAFKAAGGLPYPPKDAPATKHEEPQRKPQGFAMFPDVGAYEDRTVKWVYMPYDKPDPLKPEPKRNQGESALGKMTKQLPRKKLLRLPVSGRAPQSLP